jgi:uncharacterized protein YwqG
MRKWLERFLQKGTPSNAVPARDIKQLMASVATPGLQIVKSTEPTRSHFGGEPTVNTGRVLPLLKGKPLPLVAQIDLEEVGACYGFDWLPKTGTLLFFYDYMEQSAWGSDPSDRDSFSVLYVEDRAETVLHRENSVQPDGMRTTSIRFVLQQSFPSQERKQVEGLALNDDEFDEWSELSDDGSTKHQFGGFPLSIQGDDMELECETIRIRVNRACETAHSDSTRKNWSAGKVDWRLMLQIDSDEEELNIMWGDVGRLYFWVRHQEASQGNFQNAWVILQCH